VPQSPLFSSSSRIRNALVAEGVLQKAGTRATPIKRRIYEWLAMASKEFLDALCCDPCRAAIPFTHGRQIRSPTDHSENKDLFDSRPLTAAAASVPHSRRAARSQQSGEFWK
jgi:hypothetical protein